MTGMNELWVDMFNSPITPLEEHFMQGVLRKVGEDEPLIALAAILVHFLNFVLLQDPNSPFAITARLGRTMNQLEVGISQMNSAAHDLAGHLSELRGDATFARNTLIEARNFALMVKRMPRPDVKLEFDYGEGSLGYVLQKGALRNVVYAAFWASVAGTLLTTAVVVYIFGMIGYFW